jgi:tetratricopeptide (TPR) repeat protein
MRQLARFHQLLGPFHIVISGAQNLDAHDQDEVVSICNLGSRLLLIVEAEESWDVYRDRFPGITVEGSWAKLALDEAAEVVNLEVGNRALIQMHEAANGYLLPMLERLSLDSAGAPVLVPRPSGGSLLGTQSESVPAERLAEALLQRGRPDEALQVSIRRGTHLRDELFDAAGWFLSERGLFERMWRLLQDVDRQSLHSSEAAMRWYFVAATATNRHNAVRGEIAAFLKDNEAPELRALFASAFPGEDLFEETLRAVNALESPTTLRAHAFALMMLGRDQESIRMFSRALRLSETLQQDSLVVACATDLANYWIKAGQYSAAAGWVRWALEFGQRNGLSDEIRVLVAKALLVYSLILTGDATHAAALVEELDVSLAGIPTSETIVSTRADWAFINGDFEAASNLYALNMERWHRSQFPILAPDYVKAMLGRHKVLEATEVAKRAHLLTRSLDKVSAALGDLSIGLATSAVAPINSLEFLTAAQVGLLTSLEAPHLAQASIALAKLHLRAGNEAEASAALGRGATSLRELGFTGWTLLGGHDPEITLLYRLFHGQDTELELRFLGEPRVTLKGLPVELGLRQQEILAMLAAKPGGLHADRLGLEVYGEAAHLSTLKAIVSRLRQIVPIENKPYRIGLNVWADFVEVERLLEVGKTREALSLYRGPLLARSDAPGIAEMREHLDEGIRRSVLASGDVEAMLELAKRSEHDLELYDAALERVPATDPRFPLLRARRDQIQRSWQRD